MVVEGYRDIYGSNEIRVEEVGGFLRIVYGDVCEFEPVGILEIGSGNGGVTEAVRDFFQVEERKVPYVAIDRDSRAEPVAMRSGVEFLRKDVVGTSGWRVSDLIQDSGIDWVVAMATSGGVAETLLGELDEGAFSGRLLLSLFETSDGRAVENLRRRYVFGGGVPVRVFYFDNDPFRARMRGETGFEFDFGYEGVKG